MLSAQTMSNHSLPYAWCRETKNQVSAEFFGPQGQTVYIYCLEIYFDTIVALYTDRLCFYMKYKTKVSAYIYTRRQTYIYNIYTRTVCACCNCSVNKGLCFMPLPACGCVCVWLGVWEAQQWHTPTPNWNIEHALPTLPRQKILSGGLFVSSSLPIGAQKSHTGSPAWWYCLSG